MVPLLLLLLPTLAPHGPPRQPRLPARLVRGHPAAVAATVKRHRPIERSIHSHGPAGVNGLRRERVLREGGRSSSAVMGCADCFSRPQLLHRRD